MSRIFSNTFAAGLVAAALATSAAAAPASVVVSQPVKVGDLDLASAKGADAFIRRVERTATDLCVVAATPPARGVAAEELRCRDQAVASTLSRLGEPMVRDEYARLHGPQTILQAAR